MAQTFRYSVEDGRVFVEQLPDRLNMMDIRETEVCHPWHDDDGLRFMLTFENGSAVYRAVATFDPGYACILESWTPREWDR